MADDHAELAWQERRAAHEVLADGLRRRIMLGGFAFGSKLPAERELALGLGVSRNTARRAMRLVAAEGPV
jgi:DNA-binding FadR family transcriptional regulator